MSHNLQQHQPQTSTSSSPQPTSSTSSAATLASLLTSALADVEKLKQEVDVLTRRAVCAENLLHSLAVEDPTTKTISNTSNTAGTLDSKSGITSQSLTPAALNALMSAESRAATAETRLAAFMDSWSELLRLEDRATDERRRLEDRVADERRKIVISFESDGTSGIFSRTSPPSYPLLRTESAPLTLSSTPSASSRLPSLRPSTSLTHQTSSSQRVPYAIQINGVTSSSSSSAIISPPSVLPSHSRIRPRTTSDASQPPPKRLRAGSASSSQIQQHTASYFQQPIHPSSSTRISPYPYQQTTQNIPPRSQQLHPSQNTYVDHPSKGPPSHSPANNVNSSNRSRSQDHASQQQVQKGHINNNNRYPVLTDRDGGEGVADTPAEMGSVEENGRISGGGGGGGNAANGAVSRPVRIKQTFRRGVSSNDYRRYQPSLSHHNTSARGREVSELDKELVGIIDDATSHVHHHHHHHHHHGQTEHDDETEQDHSAVLVDDLLDDPSRRSNLNRPPDFEVLPQDEEVDAEGEEDELSNASIDDLLLEVAGGAGAAGVAGAGGAAAGVRGGSKEGSDPGVSNTGTGERPAVKTRSHGSAKGSVSVARLTQSQSELQPQTSRSNQTLKQHLSTPFVVSGNSNNSRARGTGSHSPIPPPPSQPPSQLSQSGSQVSLTGGLTSSNSLTGLAPSLSAQHLFKAAGLPPGGYPAVNAQGERTCRQCGQPGRYKDGKCVEKWGPGPAGPGTVCDRCRKKMKRVERRGDANSSMLAQAQAQARAEAQAQQAQVASTHSQNGTLSAQSSLVSVTGRGEKSSVKSGASSRSPHVSPRSEREKEREKEKDTEESISAAPAGGGSNDGGNGGNGGGNASPTDASTDMSTDEFKLIL